MNLSMDAEDGVAPSLLQRQLQDVLGVVYPYLIDRSVIEIMANCDGKVFVEQLGSQPSHQLSIESSAIINIIKLAASAMGLEAGYASIIEGTLPLARQPRFTAVMPPVVRSPIFTLRNRACQVFTLQHYLEADIITSVVKNELQQAIIDHQNIIVVGGTGSGKTTLVNALIHSIADLTPDDRLVVLEDTAELQPVSHNQTLLHTTQMISMDQLLRTTMRLRPDRIIIGEVRGGEALALLKAWGTGHPGGICTIHANSAKEGYCNWQP